MGDHDELDLELSGESLQEDPDSRVVDRGDEAKGLVEEEDSTKDRATEDQAGDSESEGGDVDDSSSARMERVHLESVALEEQLGLGPPSGAGEADLELIGLVEDREAFGHDLGNLLVSLGLDLLRDGLGESRSLMEVPDSSLEGVSLFSLGSDSLLRGLELGEEAVRPPPVV